MVGPGYAPHISVLNASVPGTAWLTAYRDLFTKSRIQPGQTLLVQARRAACPRLIQMAHAAGCETWVTSRSPEGRALAERLGARQTFGFKEKLPRRVDAAVDNIGKVTWEQGGNELNGSTRNGERLAIGWPNSFCVIDLPSRTVLFEAKGRFPCISLSGEEVAFVCSNRKLALVTVATGVAISGTPEKTVLSSNDFYCRRPAQLAGNPKVYMEEQTAVRDRILA